MKCELFSFFGYFNFVSCVVFFGRLFVFYFILFFIKVWELYYYVVLNLECRFDLYMWFKFLEGWNGRLFFLDNVIIDVIDLYLFIDVIDMVFGGFFKN